MGGTGAVEIRPLVAADLPAVGARFADHTGRPADLDLIGTWIAEAPSAGAFAGDDLVGHLYCHRFAPDVLEAANVLVAPSHRGRGVGHALFTAVEARAAACGYRAVIVVRSSLYAARGPKPDAVGLYARLGYDDVLTTGPTIVSVKALGAP